MPMRKHAKRIGSDRFSNTFNRKQFVGGCYQRHDQNLNIQRGKSQHPTLIPFIYDTLYNQRLCK